MNTLEVETDIKKTVQATEVVRPGASASGQMGMMDCGRASERTQGVPLLLFFELGTPPTNKLYLF